ncbi:hypothetical protein [Peribacillus huizhouensis]|uniref:Bacteriophage SP-beta YorD domain-containing protein n=1 Tax=Peribacillus huizhouensis TaxID=1501239 RepID=A0ABR6CS64_9BACI|nr:hypothetical protein [Peribacillus huizhouensis]MBA9027576.1 hypothetical protein [Peribacillus huizhouensis]
MNKPEYNFGDLVKVAGYWPQVFEVECYRRETYYYPDETWTELVYELVGVDGGSWLEADEEDLTLVAEAEKAEEYRAANPPNFQPLDRIFVNIKLEEAEGMAKGERKPTARELSAQEAEQRKQARKERAEEIDNLLEIAQWNREMLAKTGDATYGDALFGVEAKLAEMTAEE